jgi:hypothetical protein
MFPKQIYGFTVMGHVIDLLFESIYHRIVKSYTDTDNEDGVADFDNSTGQLKLHIKCHRENYRVERFTPENIQTEVPKYLTELQAEVDTVTGLQQVKDHMGE